MKTHGGRDLSSLTEADIARMTQGWSAARRTALIRWIGQQHARISGLRSAEHPGQLAAQLIPGYVLTPALDLVGREVETTLRTPGRNLLVTTPPQEGKSSLCAVVTPLRALQIDPDTRIILITYADALAEEHSSAAKDLLRRYGTGAVDSLTGQSLSDRLGIGLRADRSATSRWRLSGANGGMVAVGLGSSITGRPADLLIIDDPYKNRQEADSAAHRRKVDDFFRSVALTRLSPRASVILIQTRWHPEDLAGATLLTEAALPPEQRSWTHINIPAVAEEGVPDALQRNPGEALESARGRTRDEWDVIRRRVGERTWFAMYEGVPTPPEGGLFARQWFDTHRLAAVPDHPVAVVVGVDPAETGEGDEAGIICGALYSDGRIVLTHDRSGKYTSDEWARVAVDLALDAGAREVSVESYTAGTTYARVVKEAYNDLKRIQAQGFTRHSKVLGDMPFRIRSWRGRGDAVARSALLRADIETGRAVVVGAACAILEDQAVVWQQGQHQPDRVAAAVIVHQRLREMAGGVVHLASPLRNERGAQGVPMGPGQRHLTVVGSGAWYARTIG